jgi:GntR family transcriptional regulator/MocR family aminotransferase
MDVFLTPDDPRSMTAQVYDQLRDAIVDGHLPAGSRLTPSRSLARDLRVSRATVADAYGRLVAEGYADGRRGGGTIVAEARSSPPPTPAGTGSVRPTDEAAIVERYGTTFTTDARYDTTAGRVDADLFPLDAWRRCVRQTLLDRSALATYGDPGGSPELRRVLATWVTRSRGVVAHPDQVVATQGATQAIDLLGRALLRPGDVAAVEEPGYPPVATILASQGVQVVGIPVDHDGIVVDDLPDDARIVVVTPSHQYPLGCALSPERRLALLDWATTHDAAIVEDDYDSEFRYGRRPLEPLQRLDQTGRVVYVGTFSKILSPSLRMGFLVAPHGLVPTLVALRQATDFGPPHLIASALGTFIDEGHLDRHLRRARRVYAERHARLTDELDRQKPDAVSLLPTHAGLHLALAAPLAPADDELWARADTCGLAISTLRRTYRSGEPRAGVVLGFGALRTADVPEAVRLLLRCLSPRFPAGER